MLHLPYPIVNILTKLDNLAAVGGGALPFNLDFYTEVQDLSHFLPVLAAEQASSSLVNREKWDRLNEALIGLIEDHGLVGFETLAVEDRQSMASLLRAVDRASGYVFAGARATDEEGRTLSDEASIWAQAMSTNYGQMEVRDVQERWIERKDEWDEIERKQWEEEARLAGALDEKTPAASVRRAEPRDVVGGDEEDETLVEQRRWMEEQAKKGRSGGTTAVRKS